MRISKKLALKFAVKEHLVRNGEWETLEDQPEWTLEDELKQDGSDKCWQRSPEGMLATMFYDYAFGVLTKAEIKKLRRFYGAKLWDEAIFCLLNRDHDT